MAAEESVWYKSWPCIPRDEGEKRRKVFRASFELDKKDPPISLLLAMEYARIWHKENVQRLQDQKKFKKYLDDMKLKRAGAWREYVKKRLKIIQMKQKSKEAERRKKDTHKTEPKLLDKTKQNLKENRIKSESEKNAQPISKIEETKITKIDVNENKEIKSNICTCSVPKPVIPLRCNNCGVIVTTNTIDPKNPGLTSKMIEELCQNCQKPLANPAKV